MKKKKIRLNLSKLVQDLYSDIKKTLLKDIKGDQNKWAELQC